MHDDGIVGLRSEDGTLVTHTVTYIGCGVERIAQRQLAAVVLHVGMPQLQLDAAQGQETHAVRSLEEVLVNELMGFFLLALKDQPTHFGQVL